MSGEKTRVCDATAKIHTIGQSRRKRKMKYAVATIGRLIALTSRVEMSFVLTPLI